MSLVAELVRERVLVQQPVGVVLPVVGVHPPIGSVFIVIKTGLCFRVIEPFGCIIHQLIPTGCPESEIVDDLVINHPIDVQVVGGGFAVLVVCREYRVETVIFGHLYRIVVKFFHQIFSGWRYGSVTPYAVHKRVTNRGVSSRGVNSVSFGTRGVGYNAHT